MKLLIKLSHILSNMGLKKEASDVSELIKKDPEEKQEILDLLISGKYNYLEEEEKEMLDNWDSMLLFLDSFGAKVKKISSKIDESNFVYKINIPGKGIFVTEPDRIQYRWEKVVEFVQDLIDSGKAEDWTPEDGVDVPNILYHGTTKDNLESILKDGLECRNNSRGISNRHVGCAIFLSEEESDTYDYGDVLLKVDIKKMIKDGVLPRVTQEPDIEYWKACSSLAYMFDLYLGDDVNYEYEQGMSPYTYILHGEIPPEYITVEGERHIESFASKKNLYKKASPALLFPESKVRDSSGSLIALYHGTSKDFSIEKMKLSKDGAIGTGIYLTPEKTRAKGYGERTLCVYADIKNPIIINTVSGEDPCIEALVLLGIDRKKAEKKVEEAYEKYGYISSQIKILGQKMGYDGIMQYNNSELSEVIVWDKDQLIEVPESLI